MSTQPLLQRTAAKRIALPVKVEPKVSFANERTFLSWLHFTVVLGGLAVGLLNFGDRVCSFLPLSEPSLTTAVGRKDQCSYVLRSRYVGIDGLAVQISSAPLPAIAVMVYALWTYHWRANSIRKGGRGPYDDRIGPVRNLSS